MDDRRARVKAVLERRGLSASPSSEATDESFMQERFLARAKALFYARMMFLTLGLCILAVPIWRRYFGLSPLAFGGYLVMLGYSVVNYLALGHARAGRIVTYTTLCLDLVVMVYLVAKPQVGGGLHNPLLATQLLFTVLFALLYPKPLAIVPPLLALPITTRLDQLLDRTPTAVEVLTVLWYLGLDFIIIYVLVYLNEREVQAHREVVGLQHDLRELAIVEERSRLAREIHDGLGASLSSLIIQAEYLQQLTHDEAAKREVSELKASAEEAIEELRRSLRMMREDFDLAAGLEDYVKTYAERTQLKVRFEPLGRLPDRLDPQLQLTLFRVLQEALSNAAKHAQAKEIVVRLAPEASAIHLSVKDDGQGFEPAAPKPGHYGLLNMQERASKVGGSLTIDSAPGRGTQVHFIMPLGGLPP